MRTVDEIKLRVRGARHDYRVAKRGLSRSRRLNDREEQYHYWKMKRSTQIKLSNALDALNRKRKRHV